MAVDGGAGNAISMSEIQSFYGGSNPISLSEYYRGGSEVPGSQTLVASNSDSGTVSATSGNVAATVANDTTTATISHDFFLTQGGGEPSFPFTVDTGTAGGSTVQGTLTNASSEGSSQLRDHSSGDVLAAVSQNASTFVTVNDGQVLRLSTGGEAGGLFTYTRTTRVYDMTLTNNTGQTLNLTSSPWGNDSSFTNGEVKSADNQSSNSWSWSHPAVSGDFNTNVPASGTINMDVFNAPGTPGA